MKKNTRAMKAEETLAIIENGCYQVGDRKIAVKEIVAASIAGSVLYRPDGFDEVMHHAAERIAVLHYKTTITVKNCTVLEGATELIQCGEKIGCLNFASARNPGGGFLGGAQAQEESIAMSSTLYPTLMDNFEMYEYNRAQHTYLYSDYMIYSPDVLVFRDDYGELLPQPYQLSIITSPATNIGAIKTNKPEELEHVPDTMLQRMDKLLAVFVAHNIEHLLLGAWGCGVFQNNPEDVAAYFAQHLVNGKYKKCFKSILFAVYDRSKEQRNIRAFEEKLLINERTT